MAFVAFAFAGVGDGIWHTLFGVEEDTAALLSPTHLALMIAGIVLVTGPLRERSTSTDDGWASFWPGCCWGRRRWICCMLAGFHSPAMNIWPRR